MMKRARREAGQSQIEFSLCAVFVIFLLISIADMARGLWINHTLAEAVRDGTRYAIVHGAGYVNPDFPDVRLAGGTLADVRQVVLRSAIGLTADQLVLKFESQQGEITCDPANNCPPGSLGLNWPPDGYADKDVEIGIRATYPYRSLVVMYFPGSTGVEFGLYILGSVSRERIVL